jgi:hypothetical protein
MQFHEFTRARNKTQYILSNNLLHMADSHVKSYREFVILHNCFQLFQNEKKLYKFAIDVYIDNLNITNTQ